MLLTTFFLLDLTKEFLKISSCYYYHTLSRTPLIITTREDENWASTSTALAPCLALASRQLCRQLGLTWVSRRALSLARSLDLTHQLSILLELSAGGDGHRSTDLAGLAPERLDLLHHVHALQHAPEHDVLAVEPGRGGRRDEEL